MRNAIVDHLNRRLGESLGYVNCGTLPRFAWKWAPDESHFVYDSDNRTVVRKTWADRLAADGKPIGRAWVLAQWKPTKIADHCGFGEGIRLAVTASAKYQPQFETVLPIGVTPTEELNQNYIWALDFQLQNSAEHNPYAMANALAEEKYEDDVNEAQNAKEFRESSLAQYDNYVGAFGNCSPGTAGGFMSFGGFDNKNPAAAAA